MIVKSIKISLYEINITNNENKTIKYDVEIILGTTSCWNDTLELFL